LANIINGTDTGSGGLITTGDSSDELQLQTAETTALTITSGQQSAFIAGTAAAPAVTTTGDLNTGIFFPAGDAVGVATNGAEAARFNSSGNLVFPNGQGIDFSASAGGGATSSLLDDYEEGTWTPAIFGNGGQSGQAYSVQSGTYTKIGREVTVRFFVTLSTEGTFSGAYLLLGGLPFTIAATPGTVMGGSLYFVDMATNYISVNLQCEESNTRAYLWGITAAATSRVYVGTSDLTNTTQLSGTMTYFV
jgi:hypothetical protein